MPYSSADDKSRILFRGKHRILWKASALLLLIIVSFAVCCANFAHAELGSGGDNETAGFSGGLLTVEQMNERSVGIGNFYSQGMPYDEFLTAVNMSGSWKEVTGNGMPQGDEFDITLAHSYGEIEDHLLALTKYDQVRLFCIGRSGQGRNIYSIEVGNGSKTILMTGGVHARETAGTAFIIKQLEKLLYDSENDLTTAHMLEQYKIAAIPCVNPDGWDHLYLNPTSRKKSNAAGVDLNRNMPSSNAGQLAKGKKPINNLNGSPGDEFYPGPYLGSETETKAAISWFTKYIPESVIYIDYHQSGNRIYGGKTYYEETNRIKISRDLAYDVIRFMKGSGGSKWSYKAEEPELQWGEGSFTDFAVEIACGLVFSPEFGRLCMNSETGPVPLLFYKNMNDNIKYFSPVSELAVITLEIGTSSSRLYTERSRILQKEIYKKQNFDGLLIYLMERDMGQ
jgi:hypothetical protein